MRGREIRFCLINLGYLIKRCEISNTTMYGGKGNENSAGKPQGWGLEVKKE